MTKLADNPVRLPPRNARKPKRIRVKISTGLAGNRTLYNYYTFHFYGKRPKRGDKVRIKGGQYKGRLCEVTRGWSLYRGETFLAERAYPKGWT